jgi:hypothetical protein
MIQPYSRLHWAALGALSVGVGLLVACSQIPVGLKAAQAVLVAGLLGWSLWLRPVGPRVLDWQDGRALRWQQGREQGWRRGELRAIRGNVWVVVLVLEQQHPQRQPLSWTLWRDQCDPEDWRRLQQRRVLLRRPEAPAA